MHEVGFIPYDNETLIFFPFSRNVHPTLSQNLCFVNGVIGDGTQKDEHVECPNVLCEAAS